jgi:hypothetical protein
MPDAVQQESEELDRCGSLGRNRERWGGGGRFVEATKPQVILLQVTC